MVFFIAQSDGPEPPEFREAELHYWLRSERIGVWWTESTRHRHPSEPPVLTEHDDLTSAAAEVLANMRRHHEEEDPDDPWPT